LNVTPKTPADSLLPAVIPTAKKLRLRRLLTLPFIALVLIPASIIAGSSLYAGLKAIDTLSRQLIENISFRVEQAAVHQLNEASITLRAAHPDPANSVDGAAQSFLNFEAIEKRLFELTAQTRTTSYIFFAGADGTFVGVDRGRAGGQAGATVRLQLEPNMPRKIYSARTPMDRTRLIETESRVYNARDRVWFYTAKDAQKVSWTPIYVSFASGELVTTASQPVVSKSGKFLGVIAADVVLTELSAFMKTVNISPNGLAYIIDSQGFLVASSSNDAPFKMAGTEQKRVTAAEAPNELMKSSAIWLQTTTPVRAPGEARGPISASDKIARSTVLTSSLGKVDVSSRSVSGLEGADWEIVVAVPRSDFTSTIVSSAIATFLVTIGALICSLLLGLWVLRRVTSDVEALVRSTNQVSGDTLPTDLPDAKLHETALLGDAFRAMIERVRQSLSTIRAQNEELADLNAGLEARVTMRTDELRARNERLSDEIALRTRYERELMDASREAVNMADNKAKFLAMLSHELRTPLQAVIGSGQMLSARLADKPSELATLDAGAKSLLALVDGVLAFSRLEAGRVKPLPTRFELANCVEEARLVVAAARAEENPDISVEITPGVPRKVLADAGMIRQVIINLLHNAIRHAPNKPVIVRLAPDTTRRHVATTASVHADWLRFSVIDLGPGISAENQQRLFRPFEQLGEISGADPTRGSGLGLAICALLVKEMNGVISVDSEEGKGATFSFSVPLEVVGSASQNTGAHLTGELVGSHGRASKPIPQQRVLLVEDHPTNRVLVAQLLERLNQSVVAVESGEQALVELSRQAFNLVVLDMNLPGINGIETARRMLTPEFARDAAYPFKRPMFAALTASDDPADRKRALDTGFDLFLTKPTTLSKLEAMLLSASRPKKAVVPERSEQEKALSPALDLEMLDTLLAADKASQVPFLRPLLEQFSTDVSAEVDAIEKALLDHDSTALRAQCHSTRGAALSIGASKLAAQVEVVSKSPARADLLVLRTAVSDTQQALKHWIEMHLAASS
jgi:signal transduction histidine kinase/CheY-like chemotaxis protein